jgi:hypothetical protein
MTPRAHLTALRARQRTNARTYARFLAALPRCYRYPDTPCPPQCTYPDSHDPGCRFLRLDYFHGPRFYDLDPIAQRLTEPGAPCDYYAAQSRQEVATRVVRKGREKGRTNVVYGVDPDDLGL